MAGWLAVGDNGERKREREKRQLQTVCAGGGRRNLSLLASRGLVVMLLLGQVFGKERTAKKDFCHQPEEKDCLLAIASVFHTHVGKRHFSKKKKKKEEEML